jgi:hypothetical protein
MERAFSPCLLDVSILGLRPRLVWHRAFGAPVAAKQSCQSAKGAFHISLGRTPDCHRKKQKG